MPPTKKKKQTHPYEARDNGLYVVKGDSELQLTNFNARVTDEVCYDDGEHQERMYRMEAHLDGHSRTFDVSAREYDNLSWVSENIGFQARLPIGWRERKHVPEAIQLLSFDAGFNQKQVFTHSGWHQLDNGEWAYLFEGGGIGAEGLLDISVNLPGDKLPHYQLPPPLDDPTNAIWESFCLLDLAKWDIMLPLLAAVYRAPLGPSDYSVFVNGRTGSFKSELTALCQQHYGKRFIRTNLPESWGSTGYSLLSYSYFVKDGLFTVDDFKPTVGSYQKLQQNADNLFRSQGNKSGRSRLSSDGKLQKDYRYPRGVILSSGEDIPEGESLRSRLLTITIPPNAVPAGKLSEYQQIACQGVYAEAMASYVQWLASDYGETLASLENRITEVRDGLPENTWHKRTTTNIANALIGIKSFLDFMVAYDVLSEPDADNYYQDFRECFIEIGKQNQVTLKSEDECERFIESIQSALQTRECRVSNLMNGEVPGNMSAELLGWKDEQYYYLEPNKAYEVALRKLKKQGCSLYVGKNTLLERLASSGHIQGRGTRNTIRKRIGGKQQRVIAIRCELLE